LRFVRTTWRITKKPKVTLFRQVNLFLGVPNCQTSVIPMPHGNEVPTKTPMAYCGNIFQREPTFAKSRKTQLLKPSKG
jgi:hypothetical protein